MPEYVSIPEFNDFVISTDGDIIGPKGFKSKFLLNKRYPAVQFQDKTRMISRLLVEAFLPEFNETKYRVSYKDGNSLNCVFENLIVIRRGFTVDSSQLVGEIWRDLPDFEGIYEISSCGRVRHINGTIQESCLVGRRKRYLQVKLSTKGTIVSKYVARLVAEVFIRKAKPGEQIDHKNLNTKDNRVENLTWVTPSKNVLLSYDVRRERNQIRVGHSRKAIQSVTVSQILTLNSLGWSGLKISDFTSVPHSTVMTVVKLKTKIARKIADQLKQSGKASL